MFALELSSLSKEELLAANDIGKAVDIDGLMTAARRPGEDSKVDMDGLLANVKVMSVTVLTHKLCHRNVKSASIFCDVIGLHSLPAASHHCRHYRTPPQDRNEGKE